MSFLLTEKMKRRKCQPKGVFGRNKLDFLPIIESGDEGFEVIFLKEFLWESSTPSMLLNRKLLKQVR